MKKQIVSEFGSEFDIDSNQPFLLETPSGLFTDMELFRSGRDALRRVAKQQNLKQVLLPSLCCQSMVDPFLQSGYQPVFYPLNNNLEAIQDKLEALMTTPSILLNLNYFGKNIISGDLIHTLRKIHPDSFFLLDNTQSLLTDPTEYSIYDAIVVSVRKWFALPDGGTLWQRNSVKQDFPPASEFACLRKKAMHEKSEYLFSGISEQKESFRTLLGQATELIDTDQSIAGIFPESNEILQYMDCQAILEKRASNCSTLREVLRDCSKVTFLPDRPQGGGLYFPILVDNRDKIQSLLAARGIYCPVIWPIPIQHTDVGVVEHKIASSMLAIPCDQRYEPDDMRWIARAIIDTVEGDNL